MDNSNVDCVDVDDHDDDDDCCLSCAGRDEGYDYIVYDYNNMIIMKIMFFNRESSS